MSFFTPFSSIRITDVVDVLFLTFIAYNLYKWFQGTKALKALIGLVAIGAVFVGARYWGLFLTTWVFQFLWQALIILLIIVFQPEIRQVLERANPFQRYFQPKKTDGQNWIDQLTDAAFEMARRRMGALILIERSDTVDEMLSRGIDIKGDPTPEMLLTIFNNKTPLHDGAVLIRNGKVVSATRYMPLTTKENLPQAWGTRHRAALGLTEKCDAWVIVVSEERGDISFARDGAIRHIGSPEALKNILLKASDAGPMARRTPWDHLRSLFTRRLPLKLGTFALVCAIWVLLAGQQDFEATFTVPVEIDNLPETMRIVTPQKPQVTLTVRGLRKDASILSHRNVEVKLDLGIAESGRRTFGISRYDITLPIDRIDVVKINPMTFKFDIETQKVDIVPSE